MEEKEIELFDYFGVIWRRKWIIILGTVICMIIAGVVSFILKPVYEIDAIIQPGKFLTQNQMGNYGVVVVESPQQIADKVRHNSYHAVISVELNLDVAKIPRIRAENIKDTLLTRVWIRSSEKELSEKTLNSLINLIKYDIDEKVDIEIDNIDADIESREIEKEGRLKQIEILKKKLQIIDQRRKDIIKEMETVKGKISELEKEQLKALKEESRGETESLALLLYSTEIQQSLRTYDYLNEKLSYERLREEDVNSAVQQENELIAKIDISIANLKERKGRIDHTKIVKKPTPSLEPVFPDFRLNVVIAGFLGFLIFIVLAFILENLHRQ